MGGLLGPAKASRACWRSPGSRFPRGRAGTGAGKEGLASGEPSPLWTYPRGSRRHEASPEGLPRGGLRLYSPEALPLAGGAGEEEIPTAGLGHALAEPVVEGLKARAPGVEDEGVHVLGGCLRVDHQERRRRGEATFPRTFCPWDPWVSYMPPKGAWPPCVRRRRTQHREGRSRRAGTGPGAGVLPQRSGLSHFGVRHAPQAEAWSPLPARGPRAARAAAPAGPGSEAPPPWAVRGR